MLYLREDIDRTMVNEKNRKTLNYFLLGVILFAGGIIVFLLFQPAYPCSASDIGCSSVWEMLRDSAPSMLMGIGMIAGVSCIFKAVGEYFG